MRCDGSKERTRVKKGQQEALLRRGSRLRKDRSWVWLWRGAFQVAGTAGAKALRQEHALGLRSPGFGQDCRLPGKMNHGRGTGSSIKWLQGDPGKTWCGPGCSSQVWSMV